MKRVLLLFAMLLPFTAAGQQLDSIEAQGYPSIGDWVPQYALAVDLASPVSALGEGTNAKPLPKASPHLSQRSERKKPVRPSRPPLEGSMVGYIDDAIVGSQIRIRFDAGFHDNAPDRAEFFYPQCSCTNVAGAPGPNFPGASSNLNFQQLYFQAEYAPVRRFSLFAELPFRSIEPKSFIPGSFNPANEIPDTATRAGISDVRAGLKVALVTSPNHSLTAQFKAYFPSGNGSRGLGTEHYSIEPSLLYYQRLSQRWAVESQVGDWHPIEGSTGITAGRHPSNFAGDIFMYGVGPSFQLINHENIKFAPVVELFGWNVRGGLQTGNTFPFPPTQNPCNCSQDASGTNVVNLKIGARTSIGRHNSFYIGFGHAVTHSVWYEHLVRAEYRYAF
jgi:hypothetical protein